MFYEIFPLMNTTQTMDENRNMYLFFANLYTSEIHSLIALALIKEAENYSAGV